MCKCINDIYVQFLERRSYRVCCFCSDNIKNKAKAPLYTDTYTHSHTELIFQFKTTSKQHSRRERKSAKLCILHDIAPEEIFDLVKRRRTT